MTETVDFLKSLFGEKGWYAEPYKKKDFIYERKKDTTAPKFENLRENKQYQDFWQDAYNQGKLDSCVANAAAALISFELKKELAAAGKQTPPAIDPSRIFIWYNARVVEKIPQKRFSNAVCHTRSALQSLFEKGVCDEFYCKYPALSDDTYVAITESNKEPLKQAYDAAEVYRIAKYERLDEKRSPDVKAEWLKHLSPEEVDNKKDDDGAKLRENLCSAIAEGHPVQFGFHYYKEDHNSQFEKIDGERWSLTELSTKHKKPAGRYGGHAVLAIGYDQHYVICQNSGGPNAFNRGTFLVPWNWITDFEATEDFWIINGFQNLNKPSTKG